MRVETVKYKGRICKNQPIIYGLDIVSDDLTYTDDNSKKISTSSNMSQRVKEFVRQSGVEVQSPDSNSNDEFARELEQDMLRRQRERAAGFRTPPRPMPRQVQVPSVFKGI